MKRHFILIGAPGVGKGTFSAMLCKMNTTWETFSVGEQLRHEVSAGSALGGQVKSYLEHGRMIPDAITNRIVVDYLKNASTTGAPSTKTIILDGYPRSVAQMEALLSFGDANKMTFVAINIKLEKWVTTEKLLGRQQCKKCGASFNSAHIVERGYDMPAIIPDAKTCRLNFPYNVTSCTPEIVFRSDDTREAIANRFEEFESKTAPVLEFLRSKKLLRDFNVLRGVRDIHLLQELMLTS